MAFRGIPLSNSRGLVNMGLAEKEKDPEGEEARVYLLDDFAKKLGARSKVSTPIDPRDFLGAKSRP